MLNEKTDKQIKRYLKKISDKHVSESKINGSCHYSFNIENKIFHIRFADHFSTSGDRADFDIVKVRDLYIIRFMDIQYSLYQNDALTYIKSLLLVGPELSKQLKDSRSETIKANNLLNYYKVKWCKHQNDVKFMDEIWAEKESTDKENKELLKYKESVESYKQKWNKCNQQLIHSNNELNKLRDQYSKLNNKYSVLVQNNGGSKLKELEKELNKYKKKCEELTNLSQQQLDSILTLKLANNQKDSKSEEPVNNQDFNKLKEQYNNLNNKYNSNLKTSRQLFKYIGDLKIYINKLSEDMLK